MNVSIRTMCLVGLICFATASIAVAYAAAAPEDMVGTNFGILVGFPSRQEAGTGGTLLVPGTIIPLTADTAHEDSLRRQVVEKSLSFAQAAERLWSTFRLDPGRQQQQTAYEALAAGKTFELPSLKEAGVRITATLTRIDDLTATYRIVFRQGERILADSTVPVARGGRAVVGGMDGKAAPYIFVFVEPDAVGAGKERGGRPAEGLGITAPVPTRKVAPAYPEEAKQDKVAGVVVLQLLIGTDGRVHEVEVLQDPDPRLTKAAVEAVKQWEFEPARDKDGKPLSVKSSVTLNFALK
jgi:TonB family protein